MELKLYLRMLMRRWWLILGAFLLTLIPTIILVNRQPWIYEAKSSFVIRPRASFAAGEKELVDAVDTLSRRTEINTTFAEIADSSFIKQRAIDRLGLSAQERKGLRVNGKVIAGANVLEIVVESPDPGIAADFANTVGLETTDYVAGLYDVFELEPLDEAKIPSGPASPNKPLNIALGGIFGLLLGVGFAFLIEYLQEPIPEDRSFNIIDAETGVYNEPYFRLRLRQEVGRAARSANTFSVAFLKSSYRNRASGASRPFPVDKAVSCLVAALGQERWDENILAHLGDSTFALLLSDISGETAKKLLEDLQAKVRSFAQENMNKGDKVYTSVGITTYHSGEHAEEEIWERVATALEKASKVSYDNIMLVSQMNVRQPHLTNGDNAARIKYLRKEIVGR